jgi:hypothetical protein
MKYQISNDLTVKNVEDTLFILDRTNSVLHTFNETGMFLWERLQQGQTVNDLCTDLVDAYEIEAGQAQCDVADFLNALEEQKLVVISA